MFACNLTVPQRVARVPDIGECRPECRQLHDLWQRLRGTRRMPGRADFRPSDARQLLRHLMLVDVDRDAPRERRFRVRLFGTAQADYLGVDWTGHCPHDLTDTEFAARFCDFGDRVVADRAPRAIRGGLFWVPEKPYAQFESICLPLSDDGERVNMLLGLTIFY